VSTVYVVAWQYNTGGGFDWYRHAHDADYAYGQEKQNVELFKDSNWTAYRFTEVVSSLDAATDEITAQLDELCKAATIFDGPGFDAINDYVGPDS